MAAHMRRIFSQYVKNVTIGRLPGSSRCYSNMVDKVIDGESSTTVTVLNKEKLYAGMMIDAMGTYGFKLNNGVRLIGPVALFPRSALHWSISKPADITEESLSLFTTLEPKIDMLVLGVGESKDMQGINPMKIIKYMRSHGISVEILATEHAISTYSYLVSEQRYVAGAFFPPRFIESNFSGRQDLSKDDQHYMTSDEIPDNLEKLMKTPGELADIVPGGEAEQKRKEAWSKLSRTAEREKKWQEARKNPRGDQD